MLARKIHHLRHLGLGDLVGENPALTDAMLVNMQHDLGSGFDILAEEALDDVNDELHRRVVVVQNQHAVQVRTLGLRLDLGDDRRRGTVGPSGTILIVVGHPGRKCGDGG